ncbi:MAG: DNA ligase, partial [Asticcacaulis sp. 32-58-5]
MAKYRQKRNFAKTQEPEGILAETSEFRFVVQKHAANRLHYDLRLELDGVLKSWAVTRGPSLNPADKRLAVQTEDHPVAYHTFEGTIPKSEYGGGTMMIWDEGTWEPIGDPREGLRRGDLKFNLSGHRLAGSWALVRMKRRPQDGNRDNWLLIKHKDAAAVDDDAEAWLDTMVTSVASGRSMEEIASGAVSLKPRAKAPAAKRSKPNARRKAADMKPLAFQPLELATLADAVPPGDDWVHEVKFDGYRTLAVIDQGKVRLMTRSGLDWTDKYKAVARALETLDVSQALVDGEIVAIDERGQSNFSRLKDELSAGRSEALQFYAFDLLNIDGEDLRKQTLVKRKSRLEALLNGQELQGKVHYSEHFKANQDFLPRVCGMQMEGIISKRLDSVYSGRRGKAWLKVKCHKRQEFVIVGFSESDHAGRGFRSLLLGYYEGKVLHFAGKVGTGFNLERIQEIRGKLDKL